MNDSQAAVAQSAKLAKQARDTKLQLAIARNALEQFASCNLNESNCADLVIASKRIRNIALAAISQMEWIGDIPERKQVTVSIETYEAAIDALRPFAKLHNPEHVSEYLGIAERIGHEALYSISCEMARAFEIVSDYDLQPESEPDARPGADEVFGDTEGCCTHTKPCNRYA